MQIDPFDPASKGEWVGVICCAGKAGKSEDSLVERINEWALFSGGSRE